MPRRSLSAFTGRFQFVDIGTPTSLELARAIYHTNDERSRIKRAINELLGSGIVEEKQYADYPKAPQP